MFGALGAATLALTLLVPALGIQVFATGGEAAAGDGPSIAAELARPGEPGEPGGPGAPGEPVTYGLLLDVDRDPATGCEGTVADAEIAGTVLPGFERVLTVRVEPGGSGAPGEAGALPVLSAAVRSCEGGAFGSPRELDPGAFAARGGTLEVVEGSLDRALAGVPAGGATTPRAVAFTRSAEGGDALLAEAEGFYLPADGAPEMLPLARGLALAALFGTALFLLASRRSRRIAAALAASGLVLSVNVFATAAPFEADGAVADWRGARPLAADPVGDAAGGGAGDLVAVYASLAEGELRLRFDAAPAEPAGGGPDGLYPEIVDGFYVTAIGASSHPFGSGTGTGSEPRANDTVANVALSKTESADPVVAGSGTGNLVYTITAERTDSELSVFDVDITESLTLPPGVALDSAVPSAGTFDGTTWSLSFSEGPASESLTLTLTVGPSAAAGTDVVGDVVTLETADIDPSDDEASEFTSIERQQTLSVSKTDGLEGASPGDAVGYVIEITNSGPSDATGFEVSDPLPAGLTGVTWTCSASSASSSCTAGPVSGGIADTVDIAAGDTLTYSVSATIDPGFEGTLSNTVAVTGPGGGTVLAEASDTTEVAPAAKVLEIPVAGTLGLLLLGLSLAVAAIGLLRR